LEVQPTRCNCIHADWVIASVQKQAQAYLWSHSRHYGEIERLVASDVRQDVNSSIDQHVTDRIAEILHVSGRTVRPQIVAAFPLLYDGYRFRTERLIGVLHIYDGAVLQASLLGEDVRKVYRAHRTCRSQDASAVHILFDLLFEFSCHERPRTSTSTGWSNGIACRECLQSRYARPSDPRQLTNEWTEDSIARFITRSELRGYAASRSPAEQVAFRRAAANRPPSGATFLSHSSKDDDLVVGATLVLEGHGARVYVDEIDPEMPPYTSAVTASLLKTRVRQSHRFVLLTSKNSKDSRWVPWELGIADGYKTLDEIALFPSSDDAYDMTWASWEYLGLYRRIVWGSMTDRTEPLWMVLDHKANTGVPLDQWLTGK